MKINSNNLSMKSQFKIADNLQAKFIIILNMNKVFSFEDLHYDMVQKVDTLEVSSKETSEEGNTENIRESEGDI